MSIRRAVPNIVSDTPDESRRFYAGLLGFQVAMDMGWIITFVSPSNPTAQVSVVREDASAPVVPQITVEVGDVDAIHAEAMRRGLDIVHPLTDEPWGVRRFSSRTPTGWSSTWPPTVAMQRPVHRTEAGPPAAPSTRKERNAVQEDVPERPGAALRASGCAWDDPCHDQSGGPTPARTAGPSSAPARGWAGGGGCASATSATPGGSTPWCCWRAW
jgi:catechol 2,3-dioxygenase-like lactoylglutathione lyase family enzyme